MLGLDNPLVHTVYLLSHAPLPLRHQLAGLVSRTCKGKDYGLIVDYLRHDWDLE
jgi:hypothetical protein